MVIINREAAIAQLNLLGYVSGDHVYVTAFFPKDDPRAKDNPETGEKADRGRTSDKLYFDKCRYWQEEGRGIHFAVNGNRSLKEVKSCRAVFYEHDDISKEDSMVLWQALGLPAPTFQVDTGNKSIHSYWVLNHQVAVEQWKALQLDLLEFANADRQLANANRNMRLAGSTHPVTGNLVTLCNVSQQRYDFADLRDAIPVTASAQASTRSPMHQAIGQQSISFGHHDYPPLEICLSVEHRDLIKSGVVDGGGRNGASAELAYDLVGTQNYLQLMGVRFQGSARSLFDEFCDRCTPPISQGARDQTWKSAENHKGGRVAPSLPGTAIENCLKAWSKRQSVENNRLTASPVNPAATPADTSDRSEIGQVKAAYSAMLDEIENLEAIASSPHEFDYMVREYLKKNQIHDSRTKSLIEGMKSRKRDRVPLVVKDAHDILESDIKNEWLISGVMPAARVIGIGATAGAGKTTLMMELGKHIASKGDWNRFEVQRGKVLVLQGDEPEGDTKAKLRIMDFKHEVDRGTFEFVLNWRFTQMQQLKKILTEGQGAYKLVVIDSWYACNAGSGLDLSKPEAGQFIYEHLVPLAQEMGVTIAIIHHFNKSGGFSDSQTFVNACSEVWQLEYPDRAADLGKDYRILNITKSRSGLKGKYLLKQNANNYSWDHEGAFDSGYVASAHPMDVLQYFRDRPASNVGAYQVAEHVTCTQKEIEDHCQALHQWGVLESEWVGIPANNGQRANGFFSYRLSDTERAALLENAPVDAPTPIAPPVEASAPNLETAWDSSPDFTSQRSRIAQPAAEQIHQTTEGLDEAEVLFDDPDRELTEPDDFFDEAPAPSEPIAQPEYAGAIASAAAAAEEDFGSDDWVDF